MATASMAAMSVRLQCTPPLHHASLHSSTTMASSACSASSRSSSSGANNCSCGCCKAPARLALMKRLQTAKAVTHGQGLSTASGHHGQGWAFESRFHGSTLNRRCHLGEGSGRQRRGDGVKVAASLAAEVEAEKGEGEGSEGTKILNPKSVKVPFGGREITIELGRMGRQANGAVTATDGDTVLFCTACMADDAAEGGDFLPLTVNYQERFSAAGKTSGGFLKREGRPKDSEVLVSRLIDRPIRPIFPKGFTTETQILSWLLSFDALHASEPLAITAAGAALAVSDIPSSKVVAGVRVGLIRRQQGEGQGVKEQLVVNPTIPEMQQSRLDLVIAGTEDSVLMIEGYCDLLTEEQLLEAVAVGQEAIAEICRVISAWAAEVGKDKRRDMIQLPPPELEGRIQAIIGSDLETALRIAAKKERGAAMAAVEARVMEELTEEGRRGVKELDKKILEEGEEMSWKATGSAVDDADDDELDDGDDDVAILSDDDISVAAKLALASSLSSSASSSSILSSSSQKKTKASEELFSVSDVKRVLKEVSSKTMRRLVLKEQFRSDGRNPRQIRPIESQCGLLPRVHGSALFTRGETQALAVTTLGGDEMAQRLDNLLPAAEPKRFYLQYSFPPCSVGETGRIGAVGRREVGHGQLAERAIEPMVPSQADFPYTIRVESLITESNGSSSMASVCGGCLALLDAGVPLKGPVAGVAMGLIMGQGEGGEGGEGDAAEAAASEPVILSDILGSEDALGDMDFKVAGNDVGVTAFQMDIKVEGITVDIMKRALEQAKEGRIQILREMEKASPPPSRELSAFAPCIEQIKVNPEKLSVVIGSGGKTVKGIIEDTGVDSIDIQDSGDIRILSRSKAAIQLARERILGLVMVPEVGKVYRNCLVKSIMLYGCFVEIAPGKEGLVHISELDTQRVEKVEDVVKEGEVIDVKLIEINNRGQLRLSRKALFEVESEEKAGDSAEEKGEERRTAANGTRAQDVGRSERRTERRKPAFRDARAANPRFKE